MTSYTWTTGVSGDWNTALDWTPNGVPDDITADVTIDATPVSGAFTVTIAAGESELINSLTLNAVNNLTGSNSPVYDAAEMEIDGTLTFAPGSAGAIAGSLQTAIFMANGTIVNAGTVNAFVQANGNVLFTGTNGIYFTNYLQALAGTVTIDTSSIAELNGNVLFDGIYEAKGTDATVNFGGPLEHLIVNIATIEGPPLNPGGWTELTYNDPGAVIEEWNGTAYVPVESTLTEIAAGGTVDVLAGRTYTTTNVMTIETGGLFNLQAGTVTTAGIDINGGVVLGYATITSNVVNNGTLMATGGTLDITGSVTGTGAIDFDFDQEVGTVDTTGATLNVGSVSAGQVVTMNGDDTLVLASPSSFLGTVDMKIGDTLVLDGVTGTTAVDTAGTLVVTNGGTTVASIHLGGTYAGDTFSVSGSVVSLGLTPLPPVISGTVANQAVASQGLIAPFSTVTVTDSNISQTETLSVTLSSAANGTLTNLGGGTYNSVTGVYTDTGTAAAVTTALQGLVFVPTAEEVAPGQTVTTTFVISDIDTAQAIASDNTTSVIATAGTVLPTISGVVAGQTVAASAALSPFSGVTIGDLNIGQTETVTVTLSNAANGTITDGSGGSYNAQTGVYTVTGSAATVTTDLDALVFTAATSTVPLTTTFTIVDTDTAGSSVTDSTTTVNASAGTTQILNNSNNTSYMYVFNPTNTVAETITLYSGLNATGSVISNIVDNDDGTSLLYAYNPTNTVLETASEYSATNNANGAPAGSEISEVVDNSNGTSLVYAYNPTDTVTLTAQAWSATNPNNGAPAGSEISEVVDNTNGTSLLYSYNPTNSVSQTISEYSATNAGDGSPAGSQISDIVDNTNGTSILYAYNPSQTVSLTASYYSSYDSNTGAPTGTLTSETIDYTNGESSITTYTGSNSSTTDYSGANGTGSVIPGITAPVGSNAEILSVMNSNTITVSNSNQVIDPGSSGFTIQFAAGATNDAVTLYAGGVDQITGFDPSAGDMLDLSQLLSGAQLSIADAVPQLSNYVTVQDVNGSAAIYFDPTGHGGGSQVALLVNDGSLVAQLQTNKSFQV